MIFTCANLRNKKCEIKVGGDDEKSSILLNDEEIKVKTISLIECSLTKEYVNVVVFLSEQYKKKHELFLEYSWLQNNKKLDDEDRVEKANKDCILLFDKLSCFSKCDMHSSNNFEGRFDGTYDMATIFNVGHYLVSPTTKTLLDLKKVNALFFERMASYQKNFDITFGLTDNTVSSIFTINRKTFYKVVKSMFNELPQYEGGPDPLPWPQILKTMKSDNLSWKEVSDMFLGGDEEADEDGSSDWSEGSEEEEDDDEEFDNMVDEEEEEDEEEVSEDDEEEEDEEELSEDDEEEEEDMTTVDDTGKRKYDSDSTDENEPKKIKL